MNAKKLLSTLLSAAMAVSMLAGCFGGGGNKNYSDEAVDAANAAQSTVVFATDAKLSKSLQDALAGGLTQLDEIDDAMEADENLKPLLTSGWDLDIFAAQGEDAEAAAKTIAEQYIVSAVIGKKAEGKIAMVLHDGNGYYYVAVLTYGNGGSGSGGGAGGGSGSGDDGNRPGPGDDDDEENGVYDVDAQALDGNGTVEADKPTVKAGETVTITVTPKDGYQIDKIVHEGGTFNRVSDDSLVYTMSNVTGDVKFYVTFFKEAAPDTSTVTFTVTGEGTVTNTANNSEIENGDTLEMVPADKMTFTVTPDDGWKIAEVSGANVISNGNGSYTLSNVTENTTVTVTFEEIVYKVSPSRILNGRVVVNPSVVYPSRSEDSVTITLHPNVGYELGSIDDINVSVGTVAPTGTDNQYIWSGITKDATVNVEFKKSEYTVNVYGSYWNYGSVTAGGKTIANNSDHSVESGEDFTFTVEANPTGEIASVKVDGTEVMLTNGSYTIKDVTANHTVEVNFAAKTFSVTVDSTTNGTVGLKGVDSNNEIAAGDDLTIIPAPKEGFEVDQVKVNGNDVDPSSDGKYVVNNVQEDLTVSVTFRAKTYTVTVTVNEGKMNGSVTGVPAGGSVAYGDNVSITLDPDTTYKISGLKVDGEDISVEAGESYTAEFNNVSGNHTIEVSFVKCEIDSIEVTPPTKTEYTEGEKLNTDGMKVEVIYEDKTREEISTGYECDPALDEELETTDTKVTVTYGKYQDSFDITVNPATYNINLTIKGEGKVEVGSDTYTKNDTIPVEAGQNATLNITADDGYKIADVKVDGTSKGAANTVTFSNVNDDHTVEVTFEALKKYTVTVEKDKNSTGDGTVNKLGINTVTEGGTFTFTAKPNDNKTTVKVTVDGDELAPTSSTANGNTYTISNINENKKVIVTFAKKTHDVIVHINEQNGTGTVQYRINDGDLYTISGNNKPFYVGDGDKLTIIISPHSNNTFTVDGATPTGNQIVIEKVTDDVNITITFTKKPVTVTGISIVGNTDSFQKYYWCTEDLDLDGLKIEVTYSDTTSETLTVTDGKIDGKDVTYAHVGSNQWNNWTSGQHEGDKSRWGWYEVKFKITCDGTSAPKNLTVYVRCNPNHDGLLQDGKCDYAKNWRGTSIAPKSISTYSTDSAQEHK